MELLKEGDIIKIENGDKVYVSNFPSMFLYDNNDFNTKLTSGELNIGINQRGLNTEIFTGEYIVVKTSYCGGGNNGIGKNDYYPDGHKVYAKKIIDNLSQTSKQISDFEINFYQTGSFTCMLPNKKAIRTAKTKFVLDEL